MANMPSTHLDDLDELMPVRSAAGGRYWVECPWCRDGFDHDRVWRCYRWRVEHVCTDDAPLHREGRGFTSPE
jgi:hypothetical protein